jgi:hypothetical protein
MPDNWKESIILPISKKGDITDCGNYRSITILPITYKHISNILLSGLTPNTEKYIGTISVDFDETGQLLIM